MQDIHDIRDPIQVGMDLLWVKPLLVGLALVLILLVLFVLIRKWMKKRKIDQSVPLLPEPPAPYDAALQALEALSETAAKIPRRFYFDLTLLLRKYIGATYKINAVEMTSQQFISCLRKLDLDEKQKSRMSEFYKHCDPYKYAGIIPEASHIQSDLEFVKEQITRIENRVKQQAEKQPTPIKDMQKGDA